MSKQLSSQQKRLACWSGWFFFCNIPIIFIVGISYLWMMPSNFGLPLLNFLDKSFGIIFIILAVVGQSALIIFVSAGLAYLFIRCMPKRGFAMFISIVLASLTVWILVLDTILYHLYHYHLINLVWNILIAGAFSQVILLSQLEWLIFIGIIGAIVVFECLLAYIVWRHQQNQFFQRPIRWVFLTISVCLLFSYGIYFSARYVVAYPKAVALETESIGWLIVSEAKTIPYYIPFFKRMTRHLSVVNDGLFVQNSLKNQTLDYPQYPIKSAIPKYPLNMVMIVIDTWRFDMMNSRVTPHIAALAKQSLYFTNHYSGGNSTQPGVFSLFYSLPSTYWSAVLTQHRGPIFIQQLLNEQYQLGIFASAELNFPPFDKTVFRDVLNLSVYTPGDSAAERDVNITKAFNAFVNHRDNHRPFFGFLFYDAVHSYCESDSNYSKPFQPAVSNCDRVILTNTSNPLPYLNRYKNAVLYDDSLIEQVLQNLSAQHLLKNTIVVITADHGEEFNDEHLNNWGHGSAFDPYQLRTPLVVYWPGKESQIIHRQTSHYDIVPTLMKGALGVKTPAVDYSVGDSLFGQKTLPYLIVGSYLNYAVLQKNQTTILYPGGDYDITYPDGRPKHNAKLNTVLMAQIYKTLNRYYQ